MEPRTVSETKKTYRVVIESLATEGRAFKRGDLITAEDAPGEIESLLRAGLIQPAEVMAVEADLF